jgi:hypothetical protein
MAIINLLIDTCDSNTYYKVGTMYEIYRLLYPNAYTTERFACIHTESNCHSIKVI